MELLRLDRPLPETAEPVLVCAFDGWTDAGRAGSLAAETLRDQWDAEHLATFSSDRLYDYRDRRPILTIDEGLLGDPVWPQLDLWSVTAPAAGGNGSRSLLLLEGAEPDFGWQQLCADVCELAERTGAQRYVGLGAVPAPVPHTRLTRLIATASDPETLERFGRPHERLTVPASCQVVIETALRDAGVTTLGLWARIPHYVAGEYPEAARALASRLAEIVEAPIDLSELGEQLEANRQRLDLAAAGSDEIQAHIAQLEAAYDADLVDDSGWGSLPTGDQIAAELERFLRREGD